VRGGERKEERDRPEKAAADISDPSLRPGVNPFAHLGFARVEDAGAWWASARAAPGAVVRRSGGVQLRFVDARGGAEAVSGPCRECGRWDACLPRVCRRSAWERPVAAAAASAARWRVLEEVVALRGARVGRVVEVRAGDERAATETAAAALARAVRDMGPGLPVPAFLARAVRARLPLDREWDEVGKSGGEGERERERAGAGAGAARGGGGGDERAVLCIVEGSVASVVALQPLRSAHRVVLDEALAGVWREEEEFSPPAGPLWGVAAMWTDPHFRRIGAVRASILAAATRLGIPRDALIDHIAFSQPTAAGRAVALALCPTIGRRGFLVYDS
jgi:hypothetical protein